MRSIVIDNQELELSKKIKAIETIADEIPAVIIIIDLETQGVEYMSPLGLANLGITMKELKALGPAYHSKFFNPEDNKDYLPKIMDLLEKGDEKKLISLFQQVRPSENHLWSWYFTMIKIFHSNEEGRPSHMICLASPVDPGHNITSKVSRLLEENDFLRKNHQLFASLTKREKEILKLMAFGENSSEIAEKLFISEKTVTTHRKNIRSKLNIESNYDITRFALAFDLI